jgi:hypothetical protein
MPLIQINRQQRSVLRHAPPRDPILIKLKSPDDAACRTTNIHYPSLYIEFSVASNNDGV